MSALKPRNRDSPTKEADTTENLISVTEEKPKAYTNEGENAKDSDKAIIGFSKMPKFLNKKKGNQSQLKGEKSENPFDSSFKWDEEDPFIGVKVDFGYVPLSQPIPGKNEGFYYLYPCKGRVNAPVLISLIGGPGMCV